jgi:hypothetical protein
MPGGTGGPRRIEGVGFWAQQPYYNIFSVDSGPFIFRPPLKGLPEQPFPANAFQSWTYSYNLSLIGKDRFPTGEQFWELPPSQRPPEQIQLHSWQWSYNLSLVGKDRLPVGEQLSELAPGQRPPEQIQLHSWSWSYNLNLRGQDRLPVGEQISELPPRPPQRLADYSWVEAGNNLPPLPPVVATNVIFRQYWRGLPEQGPPPLVPQGAFPNLNVTTLQVTVPTLPVPLAKQITELPGQPYRLEQTWAWQYNQNLIGRDTLPAGEQSTELAPAQRVPEQIQLHAWQWSYNLSLVGKDRLPVGEQLSELAPSQKPYEQTQLHSWSWSYNLNLRGQDKLPNGEQVWELAPSQRPAEQPQLRAWAWSYNLNLIAQDRLPIGEQLWERPTLPIPPAQTWISTPAYEEIAKPFLQSDWPNPTQPYRLEQTWAAAYNKNLIAQDAMLVGEQSTELPPRDFPRLLQTWISTTNLALTTAPPILTQTLFKQLTELPPRGVEPDWRRSWEFSYNKNLIGQDALPFRQSDWQNPTPPTPVKDWIQQTNLALLTQPPALLPFKRTLYDLPVGPQQPAPSWTAQYNPNLVGQDALPFRQSDWPNQLQHPRLEQTWAFAYNKNLVGQDRLPFRQSDWPLASAAPALPRASEWISQTNLLLTAAPIGATTYELPPAYKLAQQAAQTFINTISLALTGPVPPIAQRDWPNPTQFARDPTLASITASYNLNLIAQDALPVRQSDWPNPTQFARDPTVPFVGPGNPNLYPPTPVVVGGTLIVHVPSFTWPSYSDGRVPQ